MMAMRNRSHLTSRHVVISWGQPKAEVEDGNLALSLPGFRNFMDPKKSGFRKKIWFIIFLSCFCLSVVQISERARYYLKYPVSMTLSVDKRSNEFQFPKISICSYHGFNSTRIWKALQAINKTKFTDLLVYGNMTVDELWSIAGEEFDMLIQICKYGEISCTSKEFWKEKYTVMGKCYTLHIDKNITYHGQPSKIFLMINEADIPRGTRMEHLRYKILLHDDTFNDHYDIYPQGSILYKSTRTTLMYWQKKYHYENTPIRPCLPANVVKECQNRCYDLTLLNGKQCRLPFMETVPSFPPCNGTQMAEMYENYPVSAMAEYDTNHCGCGSSCFESSIDVQPDSRQTFVQYKMKWAVVDIFPSRPETESIREVRAYNLPTLFSDIGGALGLYLGTSILTFCEIFETIVKVIIRKVRQSYSHVKP